MVSNWIPQPVGQGECPRLCWWKLNKSHTHVLKSTLETQEEKLIQPLGILKTIREEIEQNPNQYAIKAHYQKLHKNRIVSMKQQLVLHKILNPEVQILQCWGGNWRLMDRRRTDREKLSKERSSLYMGSQRGWCMLRVVSPTGWVCWHGAAKQGTDYLVPQLSWKPP